MRLRARCWLALTALCLGACGGAPRPVEPVGEPTLYQGRVVAARGPTMARLGGRCELEVQSADGSYLNCRIRIRCNDDLVYGLSGAGFNHCRSEDDVITFAHDHNGTRRDGDPRMFFDRDAGRVIISDDDPDVEVLVDLLTRPPGYTPEPSSDGEPTEPSDELSAPSAGASAELRTSGGANPR